MSGKKGMKKYPFGIQEEVVSRIRTGESQRALSREYGMSRRAIQCWLNEPVLSKIRERKTAKTSAEYKYENKRLKMENELLRDFSVLHRKEVRPKAKYAVIYRHRNEHPISVICHFFAVSRSGYYDFVHRLGRPEKDAALAEMIAELRERSFRTYGYRRMWLVLKNPVYCVADVNVYNYFYKNGGGLCEELSAFGGQNGLSAYNKTNQEKFEDADITFISPIFVQIMSAKPVSEWIVCMPSFFFSDTLLNKSSAFSFYENRMGILTSSNSNKI